MYMLARRGLFRGRVAMDTTAATAGPFAGTEAIGKFNPSGVCTTAQPTRAHTSFSNFLVYINMYMNIHHHRRPGT